MPAYESIKDYTTTARWLGKGFHQETDWVIDYTGDWKTGDYGAGETEKYRVGSIGDGLRFDFRGDGVDLALAPNLYGGMVEARVDAGAWRELDLRATDAHAQHRITLAQNLWGDKHHLELRVKQGALNLDGVVVKNSGAQTRQILAWFALGIAFASIAAIGFLLWRRRGTLP